MRRLGRGLSALIHEVPSVPEEDSTAQAPLRLKARSSLEKLSTRPRSGLKAARAYLDHLRQLDGRTHISLDLSGVDLTNSTMLQLRHGRVTTSKRYQFFGVSIWLG